MIFNNRRDAGQQLAKALSNEAFRPDIILGLPRGGVATAAAMAETLSVPLGVILVRKIGHIHSAEYAIGAMAEASEPIFNEAEQSVADSTWLKESVVQAKRLIDERRQLYYPPGTPRPAIKNKTVVIADDGIATGLTMQAAAVAAKNLGARRVVIAVPIAPVEAVSSLERSGFKVITIADPVAFTGAVGNHYREFDQVSDQTVVKLLRSLEKRVIISRS